MDTQLVQALAFIIIPIIILAVILWVLCSSCDSTLWLKKRRFILVPVLFLFSCVGGGVLALPEYPKEKKQLSKIEKAVFGTQFATLVILILAASQYM